jgi:hypothetical protein
MKTKFLSLIAFLAIVTAAQATVTLQIRTQLANGAGVATNGMQWGVLVDSTGNGFEVTATGSINAFDFSTSGAFGADNYFVGSALTSTSAPFGGVGVALNSNPITLAGEVGAGDSFAIFWTDGAGSYGFVTAGALLPADGSTVAYNGTFTSDPYTAQGTIVPEPSAFAALAGVMALGWVAVRRRRA